METVLRDQLLVTFSISLNDKECKVYLHKCSHMMMQQQSLKEWSMAAETW